MATKDSDRDQRRRGLYSLLFKPRFYEFIQNLLGPAKSTKRLIDDFIAPKQNSRILDVGCGPAAILKYIPEGLHCEYVGVDNNPDYIAQAQATYGSKGTFVCQRVSDATLQHRDYFDIAVAIGVVHHLNDEEAKSLFLLASNALALGGSLITIDPVYTPAQGRVARYLVSRDRGLHVRSEDAYLALAQSHFSGVETTVLHDMLRIPYTHFVMKCVKSH